MILNNLYLLKTTNNHTLEHISINISHTIEYSVTIL